MKKDLHSKDYRTVVVQDTSNGDSFLSRSTAPTDETIKWEDGNQYPLVKVHISSTSHPFYTGKEKLVDIEGRVDKFEARRKAAAKSQAERKTKTTKESRTKKEDVAVKLGDRAALKVDTKKAKPTENKKPEAKKIAEVKKPEAKKPVVKEEKKPAMKAVKKPAGKEAKPEESKEEPKEVAEKVPEEATAAES